jgi:hypothetical protein
MKEQAFKDFCLQTLATDSTQDIESIGRWSLSMGFIF